MADSGAVINPAYSAELDGEDLQQRIAMSEGHTNEMAINMEEKGTNKFSSDEEKILEVLREIVRKCTNSDPSKRPTAAEVLDMLNKCPVAVK